MGQLSSVWFQRRQISPFGDEDLDTIQESTLDIGKLVEMEIQNGIAPERIIVGRSTGNAFLNFSSQDIN